LLLSETSSDNDTTLAAAPIPQAANESLYARECTHESSGSSLTYVKLAI